MAFNLSNPVGTGTDQELLDFTRAAIAQITLHGQAYTAEGFQMTRADLSSLREQEAYYEGKVAQASGSQAGSSKNNIASLQRAR